MMTVYAIHVNCFGKYHFVCYSHIVEVNYHEVNSAQSHKSKTWSIQSSLMQDQATYDHTVQKYYCVSTWFNFFQGGRWMITWKNDNFQKQTYCFGQSLQKGMWTIPKNVLMSQSCQCNWYHQWAFWSLTCRDLAHHEWPIPIATVARSVDGLTAGLFGHSVTTCFMMTDSLTPITFSVVNCL